MVADVAGTSLIGTGKVAELLAAGDGRVKLLDATFFLPNEGEQARVVYEQGHLPGALFFDIDHVADPGASLPHMFPDAERFAACMGELGISAGDHVICTDQGRVVGACRAWWMLRACGHARVSVMDGGLAKWRSEGRDVATGGVAATPGSYVVARPNGPAADVTDADGVLAALDATGLLVLDARSAGRFDATAPEPRAGLRGGHMPGAASVPYDQLLDSDGCFLSSDALRERLASAGVSPVTRVITTCGSGVSAAVILFALDVIGHTSMQLYDGSWSEWGAREELPVTA